MRKIHAAPNHFIKSLAFKDPLQVSVLKHRSQICVHNLRHLTANCLNLDITVLPAASEGNDYELKVGVKIINTTSPQKPQRTLVLASHVIELEIPPVVILFEVELVGIAYYLTSNYFIVFCVELCFAVNQYSIILQWHFTPWVPSLTLFPLHSKWATQLKQRVINILLE